MSVKCRSERYDTPMTMCAMMLWKKRRKNPDKIKKEIYHLSLFLFLISNVYIVYKKIIYLLLLGVQALHFNGKHSFHYQNARPKPEYRQIETTNPWIFILHQTYFHFKLTKYILQNMLNAFCDPFHLECRHK